MVPFVGSDVGCRWHSQVSYQVCVHDLLMHGSMASTDLCSLTVDSNFSEIPSGINVHLISGRRLALILVHGDRN